MKTIVNYLKKHYYICYTLLFIIMCLIVFSFFWYNGKSFVSDSDGISQHYLAYLYYGRYLRSIVKSIFIDHTFAIPTFSMSIGYGSDIINTLAYYVVGDPICALTVFVPTRFMPIFYNFSIILRLWLSGLAFSKLCFYINVKKNGVYSKTAIIIGTFIYVFCGYALVSCMRHPYFINPMIYFPLILLGAEMILDRQKPLVFILSVFISAISNFYFFYMIVILTILYVGWRLITKYTRNSWKEALSRLGEIAGYSILGTAMSSVILIPVLVFFVGDARSGNGYIHDALYSLEDYQKTISGFIAVNTTHDWIYLGYGAVALIAVFLLFMQGKKYSNIKSAFIIMGLMLLFPIVGRIMNGFSYVCNRWVFGFSLLIGYIVVIMWDRLFRITAKEKLQLFVCLCGYFVLCMVMTKARTEDFFFAITMAFIFLMIISNKEEKYADIIRSTCILCVFANIAGNALLMYSPRFNNYISNFVNSKGFYNNYDNTEAVALKELTGDDTFNRYTGSVSTNVTLYTGLHSTQYYWSLSNGHITDYQLESCLNYGNFSYESYYNYSGLDTRTALSTLANVKYYVKKNNSDAVPPFGFNYIGTDNNYEVYENIQNLPFGYTYSNFITKDTYNSLTPIQKQEVMLQAVVLETNNEGDELVPDITSKNIEYSIDQLDGVQWEENEIIVTKENGTATINFTGIENAENYIYVKGLNYKGISPKERYTDEEWAALSTYDKNAIKYQERFWTEPTETKLTFTSKSIGDQTVTNNIIYKTPYNNLYCNQRDFLVNLYYDELSRKSITITFSTIGTYTFEDIEVLCQPMDNYGEQIDSLKIDALENVDFHDDNAAYATSMVTGDIYLDKDKYLLLTIPYSSGWTAYVDGEEQELLQANTMYMALKLDAGVHNIELRYHTPGLTVGLCISLAAFVIFIFVFAFYERRDKMVKTNDKGNIEGRHEQ